MDLKILALRVRFPWWIRAPVIWMRLFKKEICVGVGVTRKGTSLQKVTSAMKRNKETFFQLNTRNMIKISAYSTVLLLAFNIKTLYQAVYK
jgi:hypothetical protein